MNAYPCWVAMSEATRHFPKAELGVDRPTGNPVIFYRRGCLFVSVEGRKVYVSTQGAYTEIELRSASWLRRFVFLWLVKRFLHLPTGGR